MDRTFSRLFLPKFAHLFVRLGVVGLRSWSDDLNVILFESLDDEQSCRDWLNVQHWYVAAPDPAMRVTISALMGIGKD